MNLLFARLPARSRALPRIALELLTAMGTLIASPALWAQTAAVPVPAPIVLTGADMRPAISLNGDWHTIVDPYFNGFTGYSVCVTAAVGFVDLRCWG
jgi:hypothetical protein